MNGDMVKKFKFCALWSDDKIEVWLGEMAKQGLHLRSVSLFNRYTFVRGEPADVSYQLDFMLKLDREGEYYELFVEAGWEHVIEFTGWQYWRKPCVNGKPSEIFTDVESKMKKFKRALALIGFSQLPLFTILVNPVLSDKIQRLQPLSIVAFYTLTAATISFGLYCFIQLLFRIQRLKRDRK